MPVMQYDPNDSAIDDNQRDIGDVIAPLAFQYKITGEIKYFNKALEWAIAACVDFPRWGVNNDDLAAGHILYALGLFYDWCYEEIGPTNRDIIRAEMVSRGNDLNRFGTINPKTWATSYMQNHSWINLCGLGVAGLAIYDEEESVMPWFNTVTGGYAKILALLGHDGASHEGVGYWAYGVEWLTRYLDISREFFGVNGYKSPFFNQTVFYRIYAGLPRNSWTQSGKVTYDYGDANGKDYSSASAILQRLADEYNNEYAQWYANDLLNSPLNFDQHAWRNIMNFNPDIRMRNINTLPTIKEFEDFGFVMARSNWSGGESYIGFRNGPALGKFATPLINEQRVSHGAGDMGHVHPDNNHFILFANGEMLLRDDGYVKKYSNSHNTLLIDGEGQAGEGSIWFNNGGGVVIDSEVLENDEAIEKLVTTNDYDYFVSDAKKSYKISSGLQKFKRHMLYLKNDDILITVDDISLSTAKPLELRFFTQSQTLTKSGNEVSAVTAGNKFIIEHLTPQNTELFAEDVTVSQDRYDAVINRKAVRIKANLSDWQNVVAFRWSKPSEAPKAVQFSQNGSVMTFLVSGRAYTLDISDNSIS